MGFDAWGEGRGLDDYLAACRRSPKYARGAWWVHARANGRLTSALLAHEIALPTKEPAVGLGSIATTPKFRGRGYASRLIREVMRRHEEDAGTEVFFLFADIAPVFYERFGFAILQPGPAKSESVLMVRANRKELAELVANPRFETPDYF